MPSGDTGQQNVKRKQRCDTPERRGLLPSVMLIEKGKREMAIDAVESAPFKIINFFYPVPPYPAQRTRSTANGHHYTPAKYKEYKAGLAQAMRVEANKANWFLPDKANQVAWRKAMRNCYALSVVFACDVDRYDIDNLLKAVMDAGQEAGLYCNDKQIKGVAATMYPYAQCCVSQYQPGTRISLFVMEAATKKAKKK